MHKANSQKKKKRKGYLRSGQIEILASLASFFYFLSSVMPSPYLVMQQGFSSALKYCSTERI